MFARRMVLHLRSLKQQHVNPVYLTKVPLASTHIHTPVCIQESKSQCSAVILPLSLRRVSKGMLRGRPAMPSIRGRSKAQAFTVSDSHVLSLENPVEDLAL